MDRTYTDINGREIKAGDIIMWLRPRDKNGRTKCRARLVAVPRRLTDYPLVAKARDRFESPIVKATADNRLSVVGNITEGVNSDLSRAMWEQAKHLSDDIKLLN